MSAACARLGQGVGLALLALGSGLCVAQNTPTSGASAPATRGEAASGTPKRPKTCLVLSGGGARGAAHVGVLKVLEEMRVPIDCIAGTSMGAIVGAAYATGMSLDEMHELIGNLSVDKLFKETPPRAELATRRKYDDYRNYFSPEFGVGEGSLMTKGAISGVQLETVLRQMSKVRGYRKFDTLPIPFRAVATDLVRGKEVVFSEGDLPRVMRASMSVPGAVAPAEFDGMMLVDGMLTSNLPVQTARAMGAELIIAVNVGTPLLKRSQLNSILGVTAQVLSILTEQNVQTSIAQLGPRDILISPELGDYSNAAFDDLPRIVPLGEEAARKVADQLARLSLTAPEYAAVRRRQRSIVTADMRPIDEIRVAGLHRVTEASVRAVMESRAAEPVDQAVLDGDMRRIYGTGDFEHVGYRIQDSETQRVLVVEAEEKSWGPGYLRLGIALASDFSGETEFGLLASYRRTWINRLGAEWRTDVQLGSNNHLISEFYQPLTTAGAWFVAPHLAFEHRSTHLYQGSDRIATYDLSSQLVSVDIGVQLHTYGELRAGFLTGRIKQELDTGPSALRPPHEKLDQGALVLRGAFDRLDSVSFPRRGWNASARLLEARTEWGASQSYAKWSTSGTLAYSLGEHTFNVAVRAGGKIGDTPLPAHDQFQWGGFLRQSGYATNQFVGQDLRYARAMYLGRFYRSGLLEGGWGGLALEVGKVGRPLITGNVDGVLKSVLVFVATDSYVGPLYLGYGRSHDGANSLYFFLGHPL